MLSRLSIVAVVAAAFVIPTSASAEVHNKSVHVNKTVSVNRNVSVHRNVTVNRNVTVVRSAHVNGLVVGRRYHGGVWYGTGRRFWHGAWYDYGVGPCWFLTPFNYYVWTCS
jgi:hypothetical protein